MTARKYDWHSLWVEYVQGYWSAEDRRHRYPTLTELSVKHGVPEPYLRHRSGTQNWSAARREWEAMARARVTTEQADRIAEARANFDNHTLLAAHMALGKLVRAWQAFQATMLRHDGTEGLRKGAASEASALASAISQIQRVGRLASGYSTSNVAYQGETKTEISDALETVLAAIDPKKLTFEQIEAVEQILIEHVGSATVEQVRGGEVH